MKQTLGLKILIGLFSCLIANCLHAEERKLFFDPAEVHIIMLASSKGDPELFEDEQSNKSEQSCDGDVTKEKYYPTSAPIFRKSKGFKFLESLREVKYEDESYSPFSGLCIPLILLDKEGKVLCICTYISKGEFSFSKGTEKNGNYYLENSEELCGHCPKFADWVESLILKKFGIEGEENFKTFKFLEAIEKLHADLALKFEEGKMPKEELEKEYKKELEKIFKKYGTKSAANQ